MHKLRLGRLMQETAFMVYTMEHMCLCIYEYLEWTGSVFPRHMDRSDVGTAVDCTHTADGLIDVFSDDSIVLASKHDIRRVLLQRLTS